MGKPRHISILPTRPISCAQADPQLVSSQPQPRRAGQPGFHSQDFSHIPETEENQNRDAEEEISSDAQTTNLAVYL